MKGFMKERTSFFGIVGGIMTVVLFLVAAANRIIISQIVGGGVTVPGMIAATLPNGSTAWVSLSGCSIGGTVFTCSGTPAPNFADAEVPAGTIDGANATFTLAHAPIGASLELTRNGLTLKAGSGNDFTLAGNTITFLVGAIPQAGDSLQAWYRF